MIIIFYVCQITKDIRDLQKYFQKFFGIFLSLRCISGRQFLLFIKKLSFFDKKVAKKFGG